MYAKIESVTDFNCKPKDINGLCGKVWYIRSFGEISGMYIEYLDRHTLRYNTSGVKTHTFDEDTKRHIITTEHSIYTMAEVEPMKTGSKIKARIYSTEPLTILFTENKDPEKHLLSEGQWRTKIYPHDLPEWYIHGYMYRRFCYLSAKGVTDLVYHPNYFVKNHLFKYDTLFISYGERLKITTINKYRKTCENYDHAVGGWLIEEFTNAVAKYSDIDVSHILRY